MCVCVCVCVCVRGDRGAMSDVSPWGAVFPHRVRICISSGKHTREDRSSAVLNVSPAGYIYWTGRRKIAMCHFRDNIVVAADADPTDCRELVSLVKSIVETTWNLPADCSRADKQGSCQGACLGPIVRCMGFCIALGGGRGGVNHIQPVALKDDWTLRLGPSSTTPNMRIGGT